MERRDKHVAHVIACARALAYGGSTTLYILKDALEWAVNELDEAEVEERRLLQKGEDPKPPRLAVHSCDFHSVHLGSHTRWCQECGAIQVGRWNKSWTFPVRSGR
jgi:hypothetical protein